MAKLTTAVGTAAAQLDAVRAQLAELAGRTATTDDLAARGAMPDQQETAILSQAARVDRMVTSEQTGMTSVQGQQAAVNTMAADVTVTLDTVRATQIQGLARLAALEE